MAFLLAGNHSLMDVVGFNVAKNTALEILWIRSFLHYSAAELLKSSCKLKVKGAGLRHSSGFCGERLLEWCVRGAY